MDISIGIGCNILHIYFIFSFYYFILGEIIMITLKEQFEQMIYERASELNGCDTEEELNMEISKLITKDKLSNAVIVDSRTVRGYIVADRNRQRHLHKSMKSLESVGSSTEQAWVYRDESENDWIFKKYESIKDAVRAALTEINTTVICNGNVIDFDRIDDYRAYYIDYNTRERKEFII